MDLIILFSFLFSSLVFTQGTEYKVTHTVTFEVSLDDKPLGTIEIGCFGEALPKTTENFVTIAKYGIEGKTYENCTFHRSIKNFMIQGGDVVRGDGSGIASIYGHTFPDESLQVKHSSPGIVSMANCGKDTNGCQFFITTVPAPWLDGKHVAFGKVLQGMDVVHYVNQLPTDSNDRPFTPAKIAKCDVSVLNEPYNAVDDEPTNPYNVWEWIRATGVPLTFSTAILLFFHWMYRKLDAAEKGSFKLE